ncbi:hypothetical protein [Streptomyces sp. NPDC020742]|uniref:hypothetical protein n=1 Tax=Streptomyces sp. NPDC020742 TaxID=3154897 RepID=UPI0034021C57
MKASKVGASDAPEAGLSRLVDFHEVDPTPPGGHCWFLGGEVADHRHPRGHLAGRVDGDPRADLSALRAVRLAMTRGEPYASSRAEPSPTPCGVPAAVPVRR